MSSDFRHFSLRVNEVSVAFAKAIVLLSAASLALAGPGQVPTGAAGGYTSVDPGVVPNNGLGVWNVGSARPTFYANSPSGFRIDPLTGLAIDTGAPLRKFVDGLPGLTAAGANNLGQYLPVAVPDATSYPGSDYYEMAVIEYAEKVHSDLPKATTFRGYVQIDRAMTNTTTTSPAALAAYQALVNGLPAQQASYTTAVGQLNAYDALVAGLAGQQAIYGPLFSKYTSDLAAFNLFGTNLVSTQASYNASYQNYINGMAAYSAYGAGLSAAQAAYTTAFAPLAAYNQLVTNLATTQTTYNVSYQNYINALAAYNGYVTGLPTAQAAYSTAFAPLAAYNLLGTNLAATQTAYNASYQAYIGTLAIYNGYATGLATAQTAYSTAFAPLAAYNLLLTNLAATQTSYNTSYQTYINTLAAYNGYVTGLATAQGTYGTAFSAYQNNLSSYNALVAAMPAQQFAYSAALTAFISQQAAYNNLVAGLAATQATYAGQVAYYNSMCAAVPALLCGQAGALITPPAAPPGYLDSGAGSLVVASIAPTAATVPVGYVDTGAGTLAVAGPVPAPPFVPAGYVDIGATTPSGILAVAGTAPFSPAVPAGYTATAYSTTTVGTLAVPGPAPAAPAVPNGYVDLGGATPNGTLVVAGGIPSIPAVPAGYTATGYTTTAVGTLTVAGPAPAAPPVPTGYVDAGGAAPNGLLAVAVLSPSVPIVAAGYSATGYSATDVGTLAVTSPAPSPPAVPLGYVDVGGTVPSGTLAVAGAPVAPAVPAGYAGTGYTVTTLGTLSVAGNAPQASTIPLGYVDVGGITPNGTLAVAATAPPVPSVPPGYLASASGILSVAAPPPAGTAAPSPGSNGIALWYPDGSPIMVYMEVGLVNGVWDHSLVQPLTLVQAYAYDKPHYLGPVLVATGESSPGASDNRPLRMKFNNLLPLGRATTDPLTGAVTRHGDLFLPFDTTLIGAGATPVAGELYMQNRVALHLHGGVTPWISDGTPYQWTVPVGETAANAALMTGVSFQNVPDMPDPGQGAETLYWTNAQPARLMFWHDHAIAQTRLNVYGGMAAGYVLTDAVEQAMISGGSAGTANFPAGTLPGIGIPLVIEDKTFVPKDIALQDAKWRTDAWGQYGDLWYPHVIETNQDPNSKATSFTNPVGRWDYALWFWPVFPVTNSLPTGEYGNVTTTPEGYQDTPTVDGTAYPTLTVNPEPTRFRILNAANDRFQNLQFYVADPAVTTADGRTNTEVKMVNAVASIGLPDCQISADGYDQLVLPLTPVTPPPAGSTLPASGSGSCWPINWPTDGRVGGVPDPSTVGPTIWHIGSEGGFLPAVASEPPVPVNFDYNRRSVTVLNVSQNNDPTQACSAANDGAGACHGLYLGPAERADVVVDFSAYAGKTLILYNDAPAPNPGYDPRIDYYTDDPDNTLNGAAPTTLAGFGPNTRTIMQIIVAAAPTAKTNTTPTAQSAYVTGLNAALKAAYATSQEKPIIAQTAFDNAFGTAATPATGDQFARIAFGSSSELAAQFVDGNGVTKTYCVPDVVAAVAPSTLATLHMPATRTFSVFSPLGGTSTVTANCDGPILNKTIQELFDKYGRMNATLGTEIPATSAITQTTLPFGYIDPNTETLPAGETQIWKITHNGVDAHPVHFHLLNVQLLNRVGWDGTLKAAEQGELGWKETIKMNPLEDVIVAVRAKIPPLPGFGLPKSTRPLDPSQTIGGTTDFMNIDPYTGVAPPSRVTNQLADFDWEYVWHCHILGHEENDFMRPFVYTGLSVAPTSATQLAVSTASLAGAAAVAALPAGTPGLPSLALSGAGSTASPYSMKVTWVDNSTNELGFRVERQVGSATAAPLGLVKSFATTLSGFTPSVNTLANATSIVDSNILPPLPADAPNLGPLNVIPVITAQQPFASQPLGAAKPVYAVTVRWATVANAATYIVQRAPGLGATSGFVSLPATAGSLVISGTSAFFTDTSVLPNQSYTYQIQAVAANSDYTYTVYAVSATADSTAASSTYSFNLPNTSSNNVDGTTPPLLVAVTPVAAQAFGTTSNGNTFLNGVILNFSNASWGETAYQVQVCNGQGRASVCGVGALSGTQGWSVVPAANVNFAPDLLPAAGSGAMTATVTYDAAYRLPNGGDNAVLSFRLVPMVGAIAGPIGAVSNRIDMSQGPAAPASFAATPDPAGNGIVNFSWPLVPSASTYRLQVKSATTAAGLAAAPWTNINSNIAGSASSYTFTGTTGLSYQFELRAQNPNGNSANVLSPVIGL
jgi:FtsP/CotA-like multicopper oxidase with cupredoxin domain